MAFRVREGQPIPRAARLGHAAVLGKCPFSLKNVDSLCHSQEDPKAPDTATPRDESGPKPSLRRSGMDRTFLMPCSADHHGVLELSSLLQRYHSTSTCQGEFKIIQVTLHPHDDPPLQHRAHPPPHSRRRPNRHRPASPPQPPGLQPTTTLRPILLRPEHRLHHRPDRLRTRLPNLSFARSPPIASTPPTTATAAPTCRARRRASSWRASSPRARWGIPLPTSPPRSACTRATARVWVYGGCE
jgi:hypothetical protein